MGEGGVSIEIEESGGKVDLVEMMVSSFINS